MIPCSKSFDKVDFFDPLPATLLELTTEALGSVVMSLRVMSCMSQLARSILPTFSPSAIQYIANKYRQWMLHTSNTITDVPSVSLGK